MYMSKLRGCISCWEFSLHQTSILATYEKQWQKGWFNTIIFLLGQKKQDCSDNSTHDELHGEIENKASNTEYHLVYRYFVHRVGWSLSACTLPLCRGLGCCGVTRFI